MPVTTYISTEFGSYNGDSEINEMLCELAKITGKTWMAKTTRIKGSRGFLRKKIEREVTELYVHQQSIEYQVITCVRTVGELRAYLFGALGAWDKIDT